jgi:hypothetical protein
LLVVLVPSSPFIALNARKCKRSAARLG